jgi:hypothetical protein
MDKHILGILITIVLLDVGFTAITAIPAGTPTIGQLAYGKAFLPSNFATDLQAPIATSDDSLYVAWWSNKTGNDEVMFKASTDSGKTFGDKMNLSNSSNSDSQDVQITASANNVYVTWWERNQTMNEPVMRVSNDNGKTFGEIIKLAGNSTSGAVTSVG